MGKKTKACMTTDSGQELMLLGVKASGAIKGRLLVMTLEQQYRNASDENTEITYTFPLPHSAVLMEVEVELNGKRLTGEVTARHTARKRYEEAISEGNSSIMLENNGDGSYTLELGNLMAREECKVLVRYAQALQTEHSQVRLMLPTTIAPRYGNPFAQTKLLPHQVPVTDINAEYPFEMTIALLGEMSASNVECLSHKVRYVRQKDDLIIQLSQRGHMDRDFILVVSNLKSQSDGLICNDLLESGQAAVMVSFNPQFGANQAAPFNAKILVDCSGSMGGDSITAARRALSSIIEKLSKEDRFSLSRFGDTVEHRGRGLWHGTPQAKASAQRWIRDLDADMGGTEMAEALLSTIKLSGDEQSDILLITDGEIHGIDEVIDIARKSGHRVFVVAIGASPAESHLRRLAHATGGHCDFVAPGEDVEPAVLRMSHRMHSQRASALRVEWPQGINALWTQTLSAYAFAEDTLHLHAFADAPNTQVEGSVRLFGKVGVEAKEQLLAEAKLETTETVTNILARLSAYAKYQETAGKEVDLAVKYQLVTEQTNFILVHERAADEKASAMPTGHTVAQMLAAGHGGSGSVVRRHVFASTVDSLSQPLPSAVASIQYSSSTRPAVWAASRTARPAPAALRMRNNAVGTDSVPFGNGDFDDIEVPAFLRKQADGVNNEPQKPIRKSIDRLNPKFWTLADKGTKKGLTGTSGPHYVGITPVGLLHWLEINDKQFWPTSYAQLQDIGLGAAICEWLEIEMGATDAESDVVQAFISVLREFEPAHSSVAKLVRRALSGGKKAANGSNTNSTLLQKIERGLAGTSATQWPDRLVYFPELLP